jgi:hypothetical protein
MRTRSALLTLVLAVVPLLGTAAPSGAATGAATGGGSSSCQLFDVRVGHRAGPYRIGDLYPFSLKISPGERSTSVGAAPDAHVLGDPDPGWARFLIDGREVGRVRARLMPDNDLGAGFSVRIPATAHVFTAEYLGTDVFAPCEDHTSPGIEKAFTLVDLWAVPQDNRTDRVTVRLRSPYRSPRGRVTLSQGTTSVGTTALSTWHTASFTVKRRGTGATALRVTFPGDPEHESLDHRVDLPRRVTSNKNMTFTATVGDVYWSEQAVATLRVNGPLPHRSSLAVTEVTPRDPDDPTPQRVTCAGARWCHVTLDPRRGKHDFQGQQVLDPGGVLRRTTKRSVYWWY